MKKITINGVEYGVKFSIRAMFIFEQITQKKFSIDSTIDTYLLFFSMILASNKDCKLTFDEFIDACDNDSTLVSQFNEIAAERNTVDKILDKESESKN